MMYRIGIINHTDAMQSGGGFQYLMSLIEGLRDAEGFQVTVFYKDPNFRKYAFDSPNYSWIYIQKDDNIIIKIIRGLYTLLGIKSPVLGRYKIIKDCNIDILLSFESLIGFHLGIPFICFIGDVNYKFYPELPEYTFKKRVIRDLTTRLLIRYSIFTVVDCQQNKDDLVKFFKVKQEKVKVILMCAPPHFYKLSTPEESDIREIINKYKIPRRYIFYPAQFWAHKNHIRLIKSLELLRRKYNTEIPVVFVGAKLENFDAVDNLITEIEMENQVYCLGYLSEKEIVCLYKGSTALVFASFADYTNIPVLEAMVSGTPIACSNLFSMPEQVGDAGLFFDPFDVEDMADKIYKIWTNDNLRIDLIKRGYKRADELSPESFSQHWVDLLTEALNISK